MPVHTGDRPTLDGAGRRSTRSVTRLADRCAGLPVRWRPASRRWRRQMAFDFPASPTENQMFTPVGGPTYVYKAPVWTVRAWARQSCRPRRRATASSTARCRSVRRTATRRATAHGYYPADQWYDVSAPDAVRSRVAARAVCDAERLERSHSHNGQHALMPRWRQVIIAVCAQTIEGIRVADFRWGTASAQAGRSCALAGKLRLEPIRVAFRNGACDRSYVANFTIAAGQANTDTNRSSSSPATRPERG